MNQSEKGAYVDVSIPNSSLVPFPGPVQGSSGTFSSVFRKQGPETNRRDANHHNRRRRKTDRRKPCCSTSSFPSGSRSFSLLFTALLSLLSFSPVTADSSEDSQVLCSKSWVAQNCDTMNIKYGKYCGVGWTGCLGEKPCDDLDSCCKIHDDCVGKKGLTDVKCHQKFKKCITKVHKSGKAGFSRDCPYDTAVPTMIQGMNLAIMFSQFGNSKLEL